MLFALVLFALVVAAGTLHRTGLAGVFALSFLSVLWLLVNKGVEHDALFTLSVGHGVTVLDAAGLAGLTLVLVQLARVAWGRLPGKDEPGSGAPAGEPAEGPAAAVASPEADPVHDSSEDLVDPAPAPPNDPAVDSGRRGTQNPP